MLNLIFLYILVLCSQLNKLPAPELVPQNFLALKGAHRPGLELTSLSPLSPMPSTLALAAPQQDRSSLWPWLWLTSAAILGAGSGAYVLKLQTPGQDKQDPQQTVATSARLLVNQVSGSSKRRPNRVTNPQHSKVKSTSASDLSPTPAKPHTSVTYPLASSPKNKQNLSSTRSPLNQAQSVEHLLQNLQSHDRAIRRQAIWELGQTGASVAVKPLLKSMGEADSQQRSLILAALSEIGVRTLTPLNQALAISVQDKNADVRKNAIRDVTRIYMAMEQISQVLGQAIADEDPEVRATAQWALRQVRSTPTQDLPALPTTIIPSSHQR